MIPQAVPAVSDQRPITIGILAGEASGDNLGRGLMAELRARLGAVRFVGVGGPGMAAEGLESLVPMDRLAVNGFIDPIRRLPELVAILRLLLDRFRTEAPDVFIGVDFNVFNLLLERRLKRRGIPTVHYVSPSVYAWRRGRIRRIARAADMLLTLYPFEPALYRGTAVRAVYVGHPLADAIDMGAGDAAARAAARATLGLSDAGVVIALLPGSRMSEVRLLGGIFLEAARCMAQELPAVRFVVPCVRPAIGEWLRAVLAGYPDISVTEYQGNARLALTERRMLDVTPNYPDLEQLRLEFWLTKLREELTADAPETQLFLGKDSPENLSRALTQSKLADADFRRLIMMHPQVLEYVSKVAEERAGAAGSPGPHESYSDWHLDLL